MREEDKQQQFQIATRVVVLRWFQATKKERLFKIYAIKYRRLFYYPTLEVQCTYSKTVNNV